MKKMIVTLALVMFTLTGCGEGEGESERNSETPNLGSHSIPDTWISGCLQDNNLSFYEQSVFEMQENGKFVQYSAQYSDGTCQENLFQMEKVGEYIIGSEFISPSTGFTAYEIDLRIDEVWLTLNSPGQANARNSEGFCGRTDWQIGDKTEITGCADIGSAEIFNIVSVQNESSGRVLYLGEESGDGQISTMRPTGLDLNQPYVLHRSIYFFDQEVDQPNRQTSLLGAPIQLPSPASTRMDYTFNDWNTVADASGTVNAGGAEMTLQQEDVMLNARRQSRAGVGVGDFIAGRYEIRGVDGGIVRDVVTGLEWMRCSEGQTWDSSRQSCARNANRYTFDDALSAVSQLNSAEGYGEHTDWRVPSIDELRTLVYCSNTRQFGIKKESWCGESRGGFASPTIEQQAFPDTPSLSYWSGSPSASSSRNAWNVHFLDGYNYFSLNSDLKLHVRFVRGGPSADPIEVTATAETGGSISPDSRTVTQGIATTFTVTPDAGSTISSVTGCGGSLSGNTYITDAISEACTVTAIFNQPELNIDRYEITGTDGEIVRDKVTGLEWMRCSVGQTWNSSTQSCTGNALYYTWNNAIQLTAPGGFRVPTIQELRTIVYCSNTEEFGSKEESWCGKSPDEYARPTIEKAAFPDTPSSSFWSGSPNAFNSFNAWLVAFGNGNAYDLSYRSNDGHVRLVRGGQ